MKKSDLSHVLRSLNLIYWTDWIRYFRSKWINRKINRQFVLANPAIALPPEYLMYESFQLNFAKYYNDGKDTAAWLKAHWQKHIELRNKNILDWGCGPGRIIRHLPSIIGQGCQYFGTDYNKKTIDWCMQNLIGINFNHNSLNAILPYESNQMDVIYGISIFTHLSEANHMEWLTELHRVLNQKGILFLTTQGQNFKSKLTRAELRKFELGDLVVRGKVKEGHRTYSAFHPKAFMVQLFVDFEILEHIEIEPENLSSIPQDIWIVRKKS